MPRSHPWQVSPGRHALGKIEFASGYLDDGSLVKETRLMFPPLAAGGHSTTRGLLIFLSHLAKAYHLPAGTASGPMTHEAARAMLDGPVDLGCFAFMHSRMGLGVFVAQAGQNRIMMHQAANDGFRGLYMVCFDGPDAGKGFVVNANGDNKAMFMNCELTRALLQRMGNALSDSVTTAALTSPIAVGQDFPVWIGLLSARAFLWKASSKKKSSILVSPTWFSRPSCQRRGKPSRACEPGARHPAVWHMRGRNAGFKRTRAHSPCARHEPVRAYVPQLQA